MAASVTLAGCAKPRPAAHAAPVCVDERIGTVDAGCRGLSVRLFPLADSFVVGRPMPLGYVIRNTGPSRRLEMGMSGIGLHILDSAGTDVLAWPMVNGMLGPDGDIALPASGFVGKNFDLHCPSIEYVLPPRCDPVEELVPGRYSVVFYVNSTFWDDTLKKIDGVHVSDTLRIVIRGAR